MASCLFVFLIILLERNIVADSLNEDVIEEDRIKRQVNSLPLIYPYGATYKLILGMTAPIPNKDHISFAFLANFQYQYLQIQNISELSQYYFIKEVSRAEREADLASRNDERLVFYKAVADMLEMKGMHGEDCLYRALCEAAQYPIRDDGLFGEVLHILLTPDYGWTQFEEDFDWKEDMSPYIDAATAGRQMFNCAYIYNKCPEGQGVLELISNLRNE